VISRYMEFSGGIGDALNAIYSYGCFSQLQRMRKPDVAVVGCISHNPHIVELFQHWPEGPEIRVRYFAYPDNWSTFRRKNRLPNPPLRTLRKSGSITFHNHPSDQEALAQLPDEYVVFSVSAGQLERNIPEEIVAVLNFNFTRSKQAVFVGRDYDRSGWGNHAREEQQPMGDVTNLINQLSLPATVNVVRDPRCKGIVTAHSSLSLVAGWERKPMLLLYPESVRHTHFRKPDDYSRHAIENQNAFHGTFDQWQPLAEQFFNYITHEVLHTR
jgi:hypothetical protein